MTRPFVTVYNEMSVDGRITDFAGDGVRYYAHGFSWPRDAILMGSTTAQAFGPRETDEEARGPGPDVSPDPVPPGFEEAVAGPRPLLVVVDGSGRVRSWRHAQAAPWYSGYVSLASERTPTGHLDHLDRRGVEVIRCGRDRVDLGEALRRLHDEHGVRRVRTDGGGRLTGALLAAGLVDELVVMVAPSLCESPTGRTLVELTRRLPAEAALLDLDDVTTLDGGVVVLRYRLCGSDQEATRTVSPASRAATSPVAPRAAAARPTTNT
ncbi:RibD family protein [Arthrobacter sp. NEB 688]|uniref:RibD family protein n=1 Tax=Arthrobacter sp. NEB 688 TaxID=904039 RepID=UPI0015671FF9|nr:RibD family protein [Arthrobacter sp. NEB 688]QKE85609.1 RibD family protein [Arthrobacter sp. NEB 688]